MSDSTRRRLLWIAATDSSFELDRERDVIEGKCIHCNRRLRLRVDGTPISRATIEHIVARTHGGTDDLENLAIACARCNASKGHRLDVRRADDPKLLQVQATLTERRRARWRSPPDDWDLPPRPCVSSGRRFHVVGCSRQFGDADEPRRTSWSWSWSWSWS